MTNGKVKVVKEQATTTMPWAIEEYKKMENFVQEVVKTTIDAYEVGFASCK